MNAMSLQNILKASLYSVILLGSLGAMTAHARQTGTPIVNKTATQTPVTPFARTINATYNPNPIVAGQSFVTAWNSSWDSVRFSCAANSSCGNIQLTSGTAAATYNGTLTVTPNTGTGANTAISMTVAAAGVPALSLVSCANNNPTTTPTPASTTCSVRNTSSTTATSISYSAPAGTTAVGPTGSCAANSTCGNVTVTTGTAPNTYAGNLTATPLAGATAGTAATAPINLTVNAAAGSPVLSLTACTSNNPTTAPTPASTTCSVRNTSSTAATSISYSAPAGTTAVGPTGSCAANSTCGNVTVTTGTAANTYTGNLTATPSAGAATGAAAVTAINLSVNSSTSTAALTLLNCTSNNYTTTPNKASTTCSLKNTGQAAITSISYAAITGMTRTGPTGACAINSVCGNVTVTTGTAAQRYTGTLTITTAPASTTTLNVDLTVNAKNAETVTYLHTDGLGSPVAKSNASGVRISQTKYEAYGMTVAGSDKPTIGFTGHYNDKDTELTYMQQRYYDPVAARFLSEDPVLTDSNTGASFNRYVYANNNPYRYIDPDGRDPDRAYGAGVALLGLTPRQQEIWASGERAATTEGGRSLQGFAMMQGVKAAVAEPNITASGVAVRVVFILASKMAKLPNVPKGPGSVPKSERDPKRFFTLAEREAKRTEQGNQCGNGCGTKIDNSNSAGHHIERHADGGQTVPKNHAEVCTDCHVKIHAKEQK